MGSGSVGRLFFTAEKDQVYDIMHNSCATFLIKLFLKPKLSQFNALSVQKCVHL